MTQPRKADSMEALAESMAAANMRGQWQNEGNRADRGGWVDGTMMPKPRSQAHLWRGAQIVALLDRAAAVLPESMTSRRSILFNNPDLARGSVETINMGIQLILPGELAWAHRHSISALRFVIKGHRDLVTVANGTVCRMETGDLVLTPGGEWHDHYNSSGESVMWLDVLDGPVIDAFNQTVFQNYGEKRQPVAAGAADKALRFPWNDVRSRLEAATAIDPFMGHVVDYLDPNTGEHPMRTLGCRMHRLPSGFAGKAYRNRSNAVFHAFKGSGRVTVDGKTLAWDEGDSFVVPSWSTRRFEASGKGDTYLFSAHDEPLLLNLGVLRSDLPVLGEVKDEGAALKAVV